jgi:cation:H+ antiporter
MFHQGILLLVGFIILVKGADIFVESACNLAYIFQVPVIIIGIVIIGFGTSLPEFAVNLNAVLNNVHSIGIGAVIGANIFNLLMNVGIVATFKVVHIQPKVLKFELPFLLIATGLLLLVLLNYWLFQGANQLGFAHGIVFLITFTLFVFFVLRAALKQRRSAIQEDVETDEHTLSKSEEFKVGENLLSLLAGIVFIIYGGDLVVERSVVIAEHLGLSNHFIGLTIVGIGTALPELVTSIMAAIKNKQDIIIGNIIGSNVFNLLFVLGFMAVIRGIALTQSMVIDAGFCFFTVILLMGVILIWKKVSRLSGFIFILSYLIYFGYILLQH